MSSHEIHQLLHEWGLLAVFLATAVQALGAPLPGGTVLVAAALYASTRNGLPVAGVLAAGALGALAGTTLAYAIGRWRGEPVLLRVGRLLRQRPARIEQLRAQLRDRGVWVLFIGRFITGVRNVVGLLAGASGMPLRRFLPVSAAAALAWSALITLEYYFFGSAFTGAPTWLQVTLVVVGIGATIVSLRMLGDRVPPPDGDPAPTPAE